MGNICTPGTREVDSPHAQEAILAQVISGDFADMEICTRWDNADQAQAISTLPGIVSMTLGGASKLLPRYAATVFIVVSYSMDLHDFLHHLAAFLKEYKRGHDHAFPFAIHYCQGSGYIP